MGWGSPLARPPGWPPQSGQGPRVLAWGLLSPGTEALAVGEAAAPGRVAGHPARDCPGHVQTHPIARGSRDDSALHPGKTNSNITAQSVTHSANAVHGPGAGPVTGPRPTRGRTGALGGGAWAQKRRVPPLAAWLPGPGPDRVLCGGPRAASPPGGLGVGGGGVREWACWAQGLRIPPGVPVSGQRPGLPAGCLHHVAVAVLWTWPPQ